MKRRHKFLILCVLIYMGGSSDVWAQNSQSLNFQNHASQYHLGAKDEILMNVNIWGYVQKPGQYVVPRHTDLISLISFAGGPREGANMSKVQIVRSGDLQRQYAGNGLHGDYYEKNANEKSKSGKVPILAVDVREHLETGNVGGIPMLKAGDTIVIAQSSGNKLKNLVGLSSLVGIIAATASIVVIAERI